MVLPDTMIRALCNWECDATFGLPMIEPYIEAVSGNGVVSYGLTSAGYDLRLGNEVLIFKPSYGLEVDVKRFKDLDYQTRMFDKITSEDKVVLPAHSYILATSLEYLRIPRWLKGRCVGKSTYARAGVLINTTPLEPSWEGNLTIEIANAGPCPVVLYIGEGIAQLEFEVLLKPCETSYRDKVGKYQGQKGVTPAKI